MSSPNLTQLVAQLQSIVSPTEADPLLQILIGSGNLPEITALCQLLGDAKPAIAPSIAIALEQLAPHSVEPLLSAFENSTDHSTQARIVQVLANIGDDRALDLLVEMVGVEIANHCQGNVRRIAARGLGKMLKAKSCQKATDKLIWALLHTEDWALRYAAAVSLGEIATEEAIVALQQAVLQESDRIVQQRIAIVLAG
jgi:phycoerythrocyanin alpha-cysteine-84 phycoviolobilin lyase/isomerase subunit PecF